MLERESGTYITELQGEALCGLQLCCTQVHVSARSAELLLGRRRMLRLEHGGRQREVKRAAGVVRLTLVHSA